MRYIYRDDVNPNNDNGDHDCPDKHDEELLSTGCSRQACQRNRKSSRKVQCNVGIAMINHLPVITIFMGAIPTIKNGGFMTLLYPHYLK